jgi:hypothetical protein
MRFLELNGHHIHVGDTLEVTQLEDFKMKVLEVLPDRLVIEWLAGDTIGQEDHIPYSFFKGIGVPAVFREVIETDGELNPNIEFSRKKSA